MSDRTHGTSIDRPLIVFADDWGRHPSSAQHLVKRMLPARQVLWVNTIGTRAPRLDLRTAHRVAQKLSQWMAPRGKRQGTAHQAVRDDALPPLQPRIVSPRMWPSFASRWARGLNRRLLESSLRPEIEALGRAPIAITTLPIMSDLIGVLPVHRWIYYCVDDFANWPGYDGSTMLEMERQLVPAVDQVIAVSPSLVRAMASKGVNATLLTHGVDLTMWRQPQQSNAAHELAGLEAPYFIFWGVIDRRMDVEWLRALGSSLTKGTIVLFGPREDPDPALAHVPRLIIRPPVAEHRLPALAERAAVLIMPYVDAPVTRAMQPLKLMEYLATDRQVVVRRLPATVPWADACEVVADRQAFASAAVRYASEPLSADKLHARRRVELEDWHAKARAFAALIDWD